MDITVILQAVSAIITAAWNNYDKMIFLRIDLASGGIKQAKSLAGLALAREENKNEEFQDNRHAQQDRNVESVKDAARRRSIQDKKKNKQ
jgi:hypothetical protein